MYKHARYTSPKHAFLIYLCACTATASPIKCMETAKCLDISEQRSWRNDGRHESSGSHSSSSHSSSSNSSCHGCQCEQHYIYPNTVFVEHSSRKFQAECHSFVPELASLLQTLESAGSIVVEFGSAHGTERTIAIQHALHTCARQQNTIGCMHSPHRLDKKRIFLRIRSSTTASNSVPNRLLCPFCADFNGTHVWPARKSLKRTKASKRLCYRRTMSTEIIYAHTTHAAMQQWTTYGCHIFGTALVRTNFWMMDFFSEIFEINVEN